MFMFCSRPNSPYIYSAQDATMIVVNCWFGLNHELAQAAAISAPAGCPSSHPKSNLGASSKRTVDGSPDPHVSHDTLQSSEGGSQLSGQEQNAFSYIDDILSAQQAELSSSDPAAKVSAARLILDMLLGAEDVPVLSRAMLRHGLHSCFIGLASADPDSASLPEGAREASLRILLILAKQPALHRCLLGSGICKVLLIALEGFLVRVPDGDNAQMVTEALCHLCHDGGTLPLSSHAEQC